MTTILCMGAFVCEVTTLSRLGSNGVGVANPTRGQPDHGKTVCP